MIATRVPTETSRTHPTAVDSPSVAATAAASLALAAVLVAADSTGLLAETFRHATVWTMLVAVAVLVRPERRQLLGLLAAAIGVAGLAVLVPTRPAHDALGVAVLVTILAWGDDTLDRRPLRLAAAAAAVLGIWRLACVSIPSVWMVSGAIGLGMGRLVEVITGRPLWIGASFAALDVLVVMGVVWAGWLRWTSPPRTTRAVYASAAIVVVYLAYLSLVALSVELSDALPEAPLPSSLDPAEYRPPPWSPLAALRTMIPWNLPLLGSLAAMAVGALMFRWARWTPIKPHAPADGNRWTRRLPAVVAAAAALLATFAWSPSNLDGKRIIAYERGHVNWSRPSHKQLAPEWAGTYGLLDQFVASLGGTMQVVPELSSNTLDQADVLLLIHPTESWTPEHLARIETFVRQGGSLLVVAGPSPPGQHDRSAIDDLLRPTGMRIRDDVAVPAAEHWSNACQTLAHPATLGLDNHRSGFGLRLSSSIAVRWPGRPILVGRWGFADPGSDSALRGVPQFEPGERLGDLVLAAERPLGRGTVVVLADDTCLSAVPNAAAHQFTGRLLSYLARRPSSPQNAWRQIVAFLGLAWLVVFVVRDPRLGQIASIAATLLVVAAGSVGLSRHIARVVPRSTDAVAVAYVDATHLEAYNDQPWSNEGIDGLLLLLARNDFLPLVLERWTAERLDQASVLVSIGPARPFSAEQRAALRAMVDRGGRLILTIGATESPPSRTLLTEFGLDVPPSPAPLDGPTLDPEPIGQHPDHFGRFATYYLDAADYGAGDHKARAWFFSPWPVVCSAKNVEVLVRGYDNAPLAMQRRLGRGSVVLIGDTGAALNHNLGYYDGAMSEGINDNADFWRWVLTRMGGDTEWVPPDPALRDATEESASEPVDTEAQP